ncbi:MAG: Arabinose 5-phosphate isomerase (EC [uncultured Sulfurovum sp.]|uniref:Arabinose 5-phosphate isomerase (EC) n=1 Tax=uncultured Sulfurovum sp. TaxID=269237 RepID=A0A6S6S8N8_9BACT|nr:MAG: Arabinose 5-phosphate isomerase (EC [uncultured Sulfurovum sp.]
MERGLLSRAKEIFQLESEAINNLSFLLTEDFEDTVKTILHSKGRLVISGMGKSGHIGVKISATLASTGTPSFFMHPAEAMHGDLGMLTKDDIVLAISNSGESEEILRIIPLIKRMGITLIGMSGKKDSTLVMASDYFLNIAVKKEACPLQLAPTTSTTATLVMGDALAIAIMEERGFKAEDFAMYHPGGSLGRKLLTKVSDIMSSKALPIVQAESSFQEIIQTMTQGKLGLAIVMKEGCLIGVISDGDLRRALERNDKPRFEFLAKEIMTSSPKTIHENAMADEAEQFMLKHKINDLVVVNDEHNVLGVVQIFDMGRVS